MIAYDVPETGEVVVFSRVPVGSYAKPGEPYEVENDGQYIRLINVKTGSGTFDRKIMYRHARYVPESVANIKF